MTTITLFFFNGQEKSFTSEIHEFRSELNAVGWLAIEQRLKPTSDDAFYGEWITINMYAPGTVAELEAIPGDS